MAQEINVKQVTDDLLVIQDILSREISPEGKCSELSEIVGQPVPDEICNLLNHADELGENNLVFWFSDLLSYEDILGQFRHSKLKDSFFDTWGVDRNLRVLGKNQDGISFYMQSDETGYLDEVVDIENFNGFIPIAKKDSNFILYNVDVDSPFYGLSFIGYEGSGNFVATSLTDHISDLLSGLSEGIYKLNEDGIVYPFLWSDRLKVRAGEVQMDEEGDVLEPDQNTEDPKYPGFLKKWLKKWES